MKYQLLDSGREQKLERFGKHVLIRPCAQALWEPVLSSEIWDQADAIFTREKGNKWHIRTHLPSHWVAEIEGMLFKILPTDFGHLGVFPEHSMFWKWMTPLIAKRKMPPNILNLFAYSGGATLAAAKAGAKVCHLDASKGMVDWARENAELNHLTQASIRWIVDDVSKFLKREIRRGVRYDGIILDPPSFGRGSQGEVFKFERDVPFILSLCRDLLSESASFIILSCHTPGVTPLVLSYLLQQVLKDKKGKIDSGEMLIKGEKTFSLPSGSFARWAYDER